MKHTLLFRDGVHRIESDPTKEGVSCIRFWEGDKVIFEGRGKDVFEKIKKAL